MLYIKEFYGDVPYPNPVMLVGDTDDNTVQAVSSMDICAMPKSVLSDIIGINHNSIYNSTKVPVGYHMKSGVYNIKSADLNGCHTYKFNKKEVSDLLDTCIAPSFTKALKDNGVFALNLYIDFNIKVVDSIGSYPSDFPIIQQVISIDYEDFIKYNSFIMTYCKEPVYVNDYVVMDLLKANDTSKSIRAIIDEDHRFNYDLDRYQKDFWKFFSSPSNKVKRVPLVYWIIGYFWEQYDLDGLKMEIS